MKLSVLKLIISGVIVCFSAGAWAEAHKVLVVMSYEKDNPWCQEIQRGIDSVLGESSDITYFYMDTKVNPDGGMKKAAEASRLYKSLQPDGVIAVDDNAQAMFVVPELKEKTDTPVMFAGVNSAAAKYGYPNSHISGVLERAHVRESVAFAKQLIPSIHTACFMTNDVPSGRALKAQIDNESTSYPVEAGTFYLISKTSQIDDSAAQMNIHCDALFVDSLEGIRDNDGSRLNFSQILAYLSDRYSGPLLGGNRYQVEQGAWAAVVKTGKEQGQTAAEMLGKAMEGTPVSDIPIVTNSKGQRVVNVNALKQHEIPLKPLVLRGATLVKQN